MKSPLLLVLWAISLTATAAYADTIKTFDYEGTFNGGHTVSGSITIDATTGVVTDGSPFFISSLGGSFPLTDPPEVFTDPEFLEIALDHVTSGPNFFVTVNLTLPVTTLVGYNGSFLCTEATPCPGGGGSVVGFELVSYGLTSGSITQVTPEPSTSVLLGTGAFALIGTVRRRLRP